MFDNMSDLESAYDDALDEGGEVAVAGLTLAPSRVLRTCDPIAYRCGLLDYADSLGIDTDDLDA